MTAIIRETPLPRPRIFAAMRGALSRDQLFAGLYILGCVNGLFGRVLLALTSEGWAGLLGVDISVIVLFACFAGFSTLLQQDREDIRSMDLAVGSLFLLLVALPIFALSWVAVTGLSLYILLSANAGSARQRGALILLALTVPMLWGRLVLQIFASPILQMDSMLAAMLLGTERVGNLVAFADGTGYMVLIAACSSFTNMSLAFLCWVSVTQWANHRWSPIDIVWSSLACVAVISINAVRIALTGMSHGNYELVHSSLGSQIFGMVILVVTIGISVFSARRELFARR